LVRKDIKILTLGYCGGNRIVNDIIKITLQVLTSQQQVISLFSAISTLAPRPTQPPVQWVPGQSGQGVKLTTHLHAMPRLRMGGITPLLPLYAFTAWRGKTFFLNLFTAVEIHIVFLWIMTGHQMM
jgi:hypothetical protein